jgi:molecular chaperone GrpE (heat shock protein)
MKPPPELGIPQPDFPTGFELAKDLAKSLAAEDKTKGQKTSEVKTLEALPAAFAKEILAVVTNIWRIKSRLVDPQSKKNKEEFGKDDVKKIFRYLESINDSLTQLGIEVIDRTGETFDYGLPEKVVTAIPQEGISKELVLETLRPTIKWQNHIFPGEVEIATPITKTEKEEL